LLFKFLFIIKSVLQFAVDSMILRDLLKTNFQW